MIKLTDAQIAGIEKPHQRSLWGQMHEVHPVYVRKTLGDGEKLLIITPIDTRPDYYVIRGDSGWALSNYAEGEVVAGHIDEIYDAIEEQCGCDDDPDARDNPEEHNGWPCLSSASGCSWGEFDEEGIAALGLNK